MDRLHRLITALLLFVCASVYASFPASQTSGSCSINAGGATYTSAAGSCSAALEQYKTAVNGVNYNINCPRTYTNQTAVCETWDTGWEWAGRNQVVTTFGIASLSCPANSTLSGSTCACNSGYTQSGSSCIIPDVNNCPKAGTPAGRWSRPYVAGKGISDAYAVCDGETPSGSPDGSLCVVSIVGDIAVGTPYVVYGTATYTGAKSASCNGDGGSGTTPGSANTTPPVEGEPAPTPCKSGEAPGTVNGITKCYPAGSTGKPVTTPSSTTTSTSVDGNTPTSTGISQSVTCQLGQCTTTTTTTTTSSTGGTSTTSSTKTESQGDYCQANPRSAQCITSSFGSGACGTTPVCDGDAIQCAVASFTFKTQCALTTAPTGSADLDKYNEEAAKAQGDQTAAITSTVNIGASSFDQTDMLGATSGLQDLVVNVAGMNVTVPFSQMNVWLARIGMVMQACTFLLCARIVMRG